jgi:diguanylate cyclase (GGDEF)-like protein
MSRSKKQQEVSNAYNGKILQGPYSADLKHRVEELVCALQKLETMNLPVIPYLAAWEEDKRIIWYEFIGQRLCHMLGCDRSDVAECLRNSVIDRRVYKYGGDDDEVEEEIIPGNELGGHRLGLREEVKRSGGVEAVYKIAAGELVFWLKDQAKIENFSQNNVYLSMGFLTDVTKEMEQKDLFERIGYFDELTRLPKRLIMNRIFEINIGHFRRAIVENFVFMMIDIDHFKSVNDTFGHQAGDHVLAALAELMTAGKRKEDEIGRYGGEEFYCFSLGSFEHGLKFAERLRENIEGHSFVYEDNIIPVTVSIGLAAATDFPDPDKLRADNLIKLADSRLYLAKQGGRNKVVPHG